MRYIRQIIPGGTYFFTVVTYQRQKIFISEINIALLRQAFAYVINRHPFKIDAIAILPDHIHTIWTLPPEDSDYSLRWQLIKSTFTRNVNQKTRSPSNSRKRKGEQSLW